MKQTISTLILVLTITLFSTTTFAQPKHGFHFRHTWYNFEFPHAEDPDLEDLFNTNSGRGVELAYQRYIKNRTSLVLPVKLGVAELHRERGNPRGGQPLANVDLLLQQNLLKYKWMFQPYVHFGLGGLYNFNNGHFDWNIPLGAGLNVRLFDDFFLSGQTQWRPTGRNRDNWQHGLGFVINFGGPSKPEDRDKDGIPDASDRCPDEFGLTNFAGCPDRDGDGVADPDDKCVDVPGVASLAGCPDADEDGITDAEDDCPTEKGLAAFKGCPDTDGDGIADKTDKCPKEKGPQSNMGCPITDRDGDGIADTEDACPSDKGPAATKGCPDRDGDGIADKDDACPEKKGTLAGKGCPDTDGDGVYDNEDRCVDKPGPASNKGCPEIKAEDKAKLADIIKNVQFETSKATLLSKSYPVLDEVVALMAKYPEYGLSISGHTDNVGDDKMNQDLSERRAKTCNDYLVSKGIAQNRMTHAGYGETRPIADNNTKAGRELNRRVDFELKVK